jgi:hypothetical protein
MQSSGPNQYAHYHSENPFSKPNWVHNLWHSIPRRTRARGLRGAAVLAGMYGVYGAYCYREQAFLDRQTLAEEVAKAEGARARRRQQQKLSSSSSYDGAPGMNLSYTPHRAASTTSSSPSSSPSSPYVRTPPRGRTPFKPSLEFPRELSNVGRPVQKGKDYGRWSPRASVQLKLDALALAKKRKKKIKEEGQNPTPE